MAFLERFKKVSAGLIERAWWELEKIGIDGPGVWKDVDMTSEDPKSYVNRRALYNLPPFVQGVDLIASKVAQQKVHVYRRTSTNARERFSKHPAEKLIAVRPNGPQPCSQFIYTLVSHAIWSGNGYAWIRTEPDERTGLPVPKSLVILDPQYVTPKPTINENGDIDITYIFKVPETTGEGVTIYAHQMIHLRGKGDEAGGLVGTSLIEAASLSLGLGLRATEMADRFYEQDGGLGSTVIETPERFAGEEGVKQQKQIIDQVRAAHRRKGIVFMANGRKLIRQPLTADECQFLGSREASRVDIASLLGLPANKLNGNIGTSYSSLEMNERAVLSDCYGWWLTKLEQELSMKLLSTEEFESGRVYIEFSRDNLIAMTENEQVTVDRERLNNGMMSERQYAEKYNLPFERDLKDGWRIGNWKYQTALAGEEPEPVVPVANLEQPLEAPEPEQEGETAEQQENE